MMCKLFKMAAEYFKTEGIVTKKTPFGEADFLVRVFTRDFGKIDILAKGARKPSSKLNFHLDMLNEARIMFLTNGSRLPTLTDAEILSDNGNWFLGAESIGLAGRVLKTLDALIYSYAQDEALYFMIRDFFKKGGEAGKGISEAESTEFLREVLLHEGHGGALPGETKDSIISLWPTLK